jgi:hypothetical protein
VVPHDSCLRIRWNLALESARRLLQPAIATTGVPVGSTNFWNRLQRRDARLLVRGRRSLSLHRLHGRSDVPHLPAASPTVGLLGAGLWMSRPDTASWLALRRARGFMRTGLQSTDRLRERRLAMA